jgi:hypothetical protein
MKQLVMSIVLSLCQACSKMKQRVTSIVPIFLSSSLKNETDPPSIDFIPSLDLINVELSLSLDLVNIESCISLDIIKVESNISPDLVTEPSFYLPMSVDPLSSSCENLPISNQESNPVHKLMTT